MALPGPIEEYGVDSFRSVFAGCDRETDEDVFGGAWGSGRQERRERGEG